MGMAKVDVEIKKIEGEWKALPDPAPVTATNTLLEFTLREPGYEFEQTDAIILKQPDEDDNFPFKPRTKTPTTVWLLDTKQSNGDFHYGVRMINNNVTPPEHVVFDPSIRNGSVGDD
jgi:hypothetical protein